MIDLSLSRYELTALDNYKLNLEEPPRVLCLPEITVASWNKSFGGFLITNGRTDRFCRYKAVPKNRGEISRYLDFCVKNKVDLRSDEVRAKLESICAKGIQFLDFDHQYLEAIDEAIDASMKSLSGFREETKLRGQSKFLSTLSLWINKFPLMRSYGETDENRIAFYQSQIVIENEAYPPGASEVIRDSIIFNLLDKTIPMSGINYKIDPASTSKGHPGNWVSVYPEDAIEPILLSACRPVVGNPKRDCREYQAIKDALPLKTPRSLIGGRLYNGYEPYLVELSSVITELCVMFASIKDVNLYTVNIDGEDVDINHDDILLTPKGKEALTTIYSRKQVFESEKWSHVKDKYMIGDMVKPGYTVKSDKVLTACMNGINYYKQSYIVTDQSEEIWDVGKVLITPHKAMCKQVSSELLGVDRFGNEYEIEAIISGRSVKDKKTTDLVASAVLARINYGYLENFSAPCEELSLLAQERLASLGENPSGKIKIYRVEDMKFLGEAVVGYLRASRLQESEKSSSRVKTQAALRLQLPTRALAKQKIKTNGSERTITKLIATYQNIAEGQNNEYRSTDFSDDFS